MAFVGESKPATYRPTCTQSLTVNASSPAGRGKTSPSKAVAGRLIVPGAKVTLKGVPEEAVSCRATGTSPKLIGVVVELVTIADVKLTTTNCCVPALNVMPGGIANATPN